MTKKTIAECLESVGMRKAPFGAVSLGDRDGIYFNESTTNRSIQIIVVGPMPYSPIDLAHLANKATLESGDPGYWVKSASFLGNEKPYANQIALERGIVSVILACEGDEKRPSED